MSLFLIEKTFEEQAVGEAYRYKERAVYYDWCRNPEYDDPHMVFSHMAVELITFKIKKFTPKGFWIFGIVENRFVLNSGKKRYAWLSKADAMKSFIARKEVHVSYARKRLQRAEMALTVGQKMLVKLEEEEAKNGAAPIPEASA